LAHRAQALVFLGCILAVAAGVVMAVYFGSQASDGSTSAQEGAEKPTLTPAAVVVEEPLATVTPTAFVEATVVEPPPPQPSTITATPIPYVEPPVYPTPPTLEEQMARLAEDCREKGILPLTITRDDSPPYFVTPTPEPSPGQELRDNLERIPDNRKLVISEDIIAVKGFAVFPEELNDPAKFSQDNIVSGIHHIPSGVVITVDHQGRETPPSIASRSAEARESLDPARRAVVEEGTAELERVLADPATFALIVEFLAQPLDPCEVFDSYRITRPELCLTPGE
jgi:hypothetical protein